MPTNNKTTQTKPKPKAKPNPKPKPKTKPKPKAKPNTEPKTGGFLPLLAPLATLSAPELAAIGAAVVGAATNVFHTISEHKNKQKELEEQERHNRAVEAKTGASLRPKKKPICGSRK